MHTWMELGPFGGHLILDFVNTVDDDGKTRFLNAIPDWGLVLEWSRKAALLNSTEVNRLSERVNDQGTDREFDKLLEFREVVWRELSCFAGNGPTNTKNLAELSEAIRWVLDHSVLEPHDRTFRWVSSIDKLGLKLIRARLALALFDLMSASEVHRLKECGRCTGLFLDQGRGRGRAWCRMKTCGNRAKVERFRSKS